MSFVGSLYFDRYFTLPKKQGQASPWFRRVSAATGKEMAGVQSCFQCYISALFPGVPFLAEGAGKASQQSQVSCMVLMPRITELRVPTCGFAGVSSRRSERQGPQEPEVQKPRKKISPVAQQSFIVTFVTSTVSPTPPWGLKQRFSVILKSSDLPSPLTWLGVPFPHTPLFPTSALSCGPFTPWATLSSLFQASRGRAYAWVDDRLPPDDLSGYFLLSWAVSSFPIATLPYCKKDPSLTPSRAYDSAKSPFFLKCPLYSTEIVVLVQQKWTVFLKFP